MEEKKISVHAFSAPDIEVFKQLNLIDNLYRGLSKDIDNHKINIKGLKEVLKKLRSKSTLQRQIASGLFESVTPSGRQEMINNTNRSLQNLYDAYKGLIEQRKHRADELGEIRIRAFRILAEKLMTNHHMSSDELVKIFSEKIKYNDYRPQDELDKDIKLALEEAKNV